MNAQLSLEFLAYLSIAGLSLAFIMVTSMRAIPNLLSSINKLEAEDFVSSINSQIASEGFYLPMQIYVPQFMCNSSAEGGKLITKYGLFDFITNVSINKVILCNPGYATLSIIPTGNSVNVVQYG